jgi:hypothetical protein
MGIQIVEIRDVPPEVAGQIPRVKTGHHEVYTCPKWEMPTPGAPAPPIYFGGGIWHWPGCLLEVRGAQTRGGCVTSSAALAGMAAVTPRFAPAPFFLHVGAVFALLRALAS